MSTYAIVLHGGPVTLKPGELSAEEAAFQRQGLRQALQAGWDILHQGGPALEDNPHFNAGRGASLTRQGEAKLDATIMDGRTLQAGAVSGVRYVQHPISLARTVLEHSPHVFLTGDGALELALEHGLPLASPHFQTEKTHQQWLEMAQQEAAALAGHDTVGAVALGPHGNLALEFNTNVMRRAYRVGEAEPYVAIFRDEQPLLKPLATGC